MGKCLDIQFYDIFLMGNSCFQSLAVRVFTGARSQFTGNCPSHWPNYHVFCLDSLVVTLSVHASGAEGDGSTCLYYLKTNKDQWLGLVDQNVLLTCVLDGGARLRVHFKSLCAI